MRIRLEKRLTPSRFMQVATPIASVLLTMALGAIIFQLIGLDGPHAIYETFITPIVAPYKWVDVMTKAAPLIIIALGLSLGNQAKIWNIGAEGQYIIGAIAGAGVAFALPNAEGFWIIPLMIAAGILGGMAWAAIPAFLKTRYRVSEVLSTLMLVYVALQVLSYLVSGPWKDPNGHNFPQTPPIAGSENGKQSRRRASRAKNVLASVNTSMPGAGLAARARATRSFRTATLPRFSEKTKTRMAS